MYTYKHFIKTEEVDGKQVIIGAYSTAYQEEESGDIEIYDGPIAQCYIESTDHEGKASMYYDSEASTCKYLDPVRQRGHEYLVDQKRKQEYKETDVMAIGIILETLAATGKYPTKDELQEVFDKKAIIKEKYKK